MNKPLLFTFTFLNTSPVPSGVCGDLFIHPMYHLEGCHIDLFKIEGGIVV